jgi:hypothetical protein
MPKMLEPEREAKLMCMRISNSMVWLGGILGGLTMERNLMMVEKMMLENLLLYRKICHGMEMTRHHLMIQDFHDEASHGFGGNLYKELMEEAKHELYPGYTEESRLSFIIKLLHIKVYNRITTFGFDAFLELLSSLLKNVPELPKSYNEMKALLWKLGFGYESINVCKYDCALFWKDNEEDDHCLVCGFTRWKVNKEGKKKVPHKVLRYFPIIPCLQRIFHVKAAVTVCKMAQGKEGTS